MSEPVSPEYRQQLNVIARTLDDFFNGDIDPKKVAFVLLIAPFDGPEGQRTNYISNGKRKDIVNMMKEIIARFEGQPDIKGNA